MRLIDADKLKEEICISFKELYPEEFDYHDVNRLVDKQKTIEGEVVNPHSTTKIIRIDHCPACGNGVSGEVKTPYYGRAEGVFVCAKCGAQMHIFGESAQEVIDKWNNLPRRYNDK